MTIWAIVPVKPFLLGKSRLAGTLSGEERSLFNRMMLEHTLGVLRDSPEVDQTLVVSRDPEVLAVAREFGVRTLLEHGTSHLNMALMRATAVAKAFAIRGILVLPADLPLVAPEDIKVMVDTVKEDRLITIAPDRHDDGTNALLIFPTGLIPFEFGPQSFHKHCAHAKQIGARLEIVRRISLGLDLDRPDDLELLNQIVSQREEAK
jgi:2-phospho-L-lactate guanylyltransferase